MYRVEARAVGGYRFQVKSKDAEITIDAKSGAMAPPDAFLAGLASCVAVYIRKYVEGARLELGEFTVAVESDLGSAAPFRFRDVSVTIDLKSATIDERRRAALLEFVKNCPIHNTLKSPPSVEMRII
jgi:uncharacterized OsmC-like protein